MGKVRKFPTKLPQVPLEDFRETNNKYKYKKKQKILWRHPRRTILFSILFGYILFFAVSQQLQLRELNLEKGDLEAKREELLQEKLSLEEQVDLLERDETVEKIAREELGLIKPGEKLLILKQ